MTLLRSLILIGSLCFAGGCATVDADVDPGNTSAGEADPEISPGGDQATSEAEQDLFPGGDSLCEAWRQCYRDCWIVPGCKYNICDVQYYPAPGYCDYPDLQHMD